MYFLMGSERGSCLPESGAIVRERTLTNGGDESGTNEIVFYPHINQTLDHVSGGVGVNGREDKVTRQSRLNSQFGRLGVPNLSNHNDVGVLTQDRTQTASKGVANLRTHLRLGHPRDV